MLVDDEEGLVFVKGNVPGAEGSHVILKDAVKVVLPPQAPRPAAVKKAKTEAKAEAAPAAEAPATENKEGQ